MPFRILTVDDDVDTTSALRRLLEITGYRVRVENDSRRALAAAREFQPHVAILDFSMPVCHGGDVAWQFQSDPLFRKVKLIVYSEMPEAEVAPHLPPTVIPFFQKPDHVDALLVLLDEWAKIAHVQS